MRQLRRRAVPWIFFGEVPGMNRRGLFGQALRAVARRPAVRWPAAIAAVGSHAAAAYRAVASESCPVENIPYCCNLQPFFAAPRTAAPDGSVRFLYCGQLIHRKGVDLLTRAFVPLAQQNRKATLTFVGEGELRDEMARLVPPKLTSRIQFAGFQDVENLPRWFSQSDVLVLPSRHDGWGVVVNQAIAAGLAVICSDAVGAAHDLVEHGANGLIFSSGDQQKLQQCLRTLADQPDMVAQMGRRSREIAENWTVDHAVDRWYQLCASRGPTSPAPMKTMSVELQDPSMPGDAPKESPLRVLLATASSGSQGGGELYLVSLAQQLQTDGHQVESLLSDHSRMDGLAELLHPFAKVHRVPYVNMYDRPLRTLGSVFDRRTIARLTSQFRQIAPDIIHVNKQNLEDGLDLLLAARRSGLPHVTTIHITHSMASLSAIGGRLRDWIARRVLRNPNDHYLAIAESGHRELKDYLATDDCQRNVHLVHNGVSPPPVSDRQSMRRQWNCAAGDIVLGCVARIEKQKNPLFAIDLLAPAEECAVGLGRRRPTAHRFRSRGRAGRSNRPPDHRRLAYRRPFAHGRFRYLPPAVAIRRAAAGRAGSHVRRAPLPGFRHRRHPRSFARPPVRPAASPGGFCCLAGGVERIDPEARTAQAGPPPRRSDIVSISASKPRPAAPSLSIAP